MDPRNVANHFGDKPAQPGGMEWMAEARTGSVMLRSRAATYDSQQQNPLSFSNTPAEGVHLLPGSTHVAVGFADVSDLAAAVSRWKLAEGAVPGAAAGQLAAGPYEFDIGSDGTAGAAALQLLQQAHQLNRGAASSASPDAGAAAAGLTLCWDGATLAAAITGSPGQPLLWVGYDASPFAVAKAAVLLEMMQQGASDDAVLQVWYSSAWSHSTKAAFLAALPAVLDSSSSSSSSSSTATSSSSSSSSSGAVSAGSADKRASSAPQSSPKLSEPVLRLLRRWRSSHDVPLDASRRGWLESLTWPNAVIGGLKRKDDRLAYTPYIFTEHQPAHPCEGVGSGRCSDVVAAGTAIARRRISRLGHLLRTGQLVVQLHHAAVQPSDAAVIGDISAWRPDSMSWSNVPDYMVPQDFHKMAQRCSAAATLHFFHSMNWVRDVKGASYIDMVMARKSALEADSYDEAEAMALVRRSTCFAL
uniref:Uncharacterized protein n=1 Tax=Tetradesmus obliquus TaxID=3088 RepID=A0A383WH56_TETOB|eukprot:jgi/Sobl393_1/17374/SZX76827.1